LKRLWGIRNQTRKFNAKTPTALNEGKELKGGVQRTGRMKQGNQFKRSNPRTKRYKKKVQLGAHGLAAGRNIRRHVLRRDIRSGSVSESDERSAEEIFAGPKTKEMGRGLFGGTIEGLGGGGSSLENGNKKKSKGSGRGGVIIGV